MRRVLVTPLLHPASVLRGLEHLEPVQQAYLRRVAGYLKRGERPPIDDPSRPPPGTTLFPRLTDLTEFESGLTNGLALDIENAGSYLLCIGLTQVNVDSWEVGRTLVLPFRLRGGVRYWRSPAEHARAVEWLFRLLAREDLAKVFHFGVTHDVPLLEEMGFEVRGRLIDTAVLAHAAYLELPLGLQFNAVLYSGATPWKHALRAGAEEKE